MPLTRAEIERYRDEGYLALPGLIPPARLARYVASFEEVVERSRALEANGGGYHLAPDAEGRPQPGLLHKVQGVCVVEPWVLELAREPELLDRVQSLLGPDVDVFGTKFFPMSTRGATSTGWHQDNHYFGTQSERVVSCALYLHATDRENGCLRVAPGSHRAGELAAHARGSGQMAHGDWTEVEEERAVDLACPPGTAVLFSANLLHGARANASGRPAYRTAWHYVPLDLDLPQFPRGVYQDRHPALEGGRPAGRETA
jgi:hypothetical protein